MRKILFSGFLLCLWILGIHIPTMAGSPVIDNPLVIGMGDLVDATWSANGDYFAISTTGGVILYDSNLDRSQILTEDLGFSLGGRLAWQQDGTLLAMTGGYDATLRRYGQWEIVWRLIDNAPSDPLTVSDVIFALPIAQGTANIHAVWSPDGTKIIFPAMDVDANMGLILSIRLLDIISGEAYDADVHDLMLTDVIRWAWTDDGSAVIAIRQGGEQVTIDPATGEELGRETPEATTEDSVSSPDRNSTATFTDEGGVLVTTPRQEFTLNPLGEPSRFNRFRNIKWSPNSEYIAAIGTRTEPNILIANVNAGAVILDLTYDQRGIVRDILFQPDGDRLIVTTVFGDVYLYDLALVDLVTQRWLSAGGTGVALNPNGTQVAIASARGQNVYIRDAITGDELRVLESPNGTDAYNPVYSVAWSPDGQYIATGSQRGGTVDGQIESRPIDLFIWDGESGRLSQTVPALAYDADYINALDWSADSRVLAWTTISNQTAQSHIGAWDVQTKTLLFQQALDTSVTEIALHPDDDTLAFLNFDFSSDINLSIDLLDLTSGEIVNSIPLSEGSVPDSIDWHPDGDYLALLQHTGNRESRGSVTVLQPDGNAQFSIDLPEDISFEAFPSIAWNPAGTQLALDYTFDDSDSPTAYGVMILDVSLETQEFTIHDRFDRERIGRFTGGSQVAWSGDGTRVAYTSITEETLIIQVDP